MKKLTSNELKSISRRLDKVFNLGTKEQIKDGKKWYFEANQFILETSQKYGFDAYTVGGVLSALSPRNKWEQNKKDTIKVLKAVNNGIEPENIKVCTFHTNKFKAFAIAKKETMITDKSLKTFNFIHNCALLDPSMVTIDIWALRACIWGSAIKIDSAQIGRIAYGQIKSLFLHKAKKLGLKGYEYQAILWVIAQGNY